MAPRFGADFGGVRVYTGPEAHDLNRAISAQAFTHGQDIYLGEGRYDPGSTAGKRLLAHVVQQTSCIDRLALSVRSPGSGRAVVRKCIQRWTIGGWFAKKGHETITDESVEEYDRMVEDHNRTALDDNQKLKPISMANMRQLEKGARWNDMLGTGAS